MKTNRSLTRIIMGSLGAIILALLILSPMVATKHDNISGKNAYSMQMGQSANAANNPLFTRLCISFGQWPDAQAILGVDGKNWMPVSYRSTSPNVFMLGALTCVDDGGSIWVLSREYVNGNSIGAVTWVRPGVPMAYNP